jgi:exonuclease III
LTNSQDFAADNCHVSTPSARLEDTTGIASIVAWGAGGMSGTNFTQRYLSEAGISDDVLTMRRVIQSDGRARFDLTVRGDARNKVVGRLRARELVVRKWRAHHPRSKSAGNSASGDGSIVSSSIRRLVSWNVGGVKGKMAEVTAGIHKMGARLVCVQETGLESHEPPMRVEGYETLSQPANPEMNGRGLAILTSLGVKARELGSDCVWIQWARITGLTPQESWTIGNVHVPHGAAQKGSCLRTLSSDALRLMTRSRFKGSPMAIFGDFNLRTIKRVERVCQRAGGLVSILPIAGSTYTRKNARRGGVHSRLDYILVNREAVALLKRSGTVMYRFSTSDHWPVAAKLRVKPRVGPAGDAEWETVPTAPRRMNTEVLKNLNLEDKQKLVLSNRFECLATVDHLDSDELAGAFLAAAWDAVEEIGAVKEPASSGDKTPRRPYSRRTVRLLERKWTASKALRLAKDQQQEQEMSTTTITFMEAQLAHLQKLCKKAIRADDRNSWCRHLREGVDKFLEKKNTAQFWKWVKGVTRCSTRSQQKTTEGVRDKDGVLQTTTQGIDKAYVAHFGGLAKSLTSQSPDSTTWEYWHARGQFGDVEALPGLAEDDDHTITDAELVAALRRMPSGKAPGPDGVPPEFLKLALVPCEEGPNRLRAALLKLANAIFEGTTIPQSLRLATLVAIPKPGGDPTDLGDSRGISLMSCVLKLVTSVVAMRISKGLETTNRLSPLQAGFRSREECVAQVAVLREIVHRRLDNGEPTYVAYLDFAKAFDTVEHAALLYKVERIGVRGATLAFVTKLYANSSFRIRIGGNRTIEEEVKLERGTRQGDGLSAILFNVFVNDIFDEVATHSGVKVPGFEPIPGASDGDDNNKVPGLLFADDTSLLAASAHELQAGLDAVGDWSDRWMMSLGHKKCKVVVASRNPVDKERALARKWSLQGQEIQVVDQYKYLGVILTEAFDFKSMIDARAAAGLRTLMALKKFLTNRSIPMPMRLAVLKAKVVPVLLYGAEVWGGSGGLAALKAAQAVLTMGAKWVVYGYNAKGKAIAPLLRELELKPLVADALGRRTRGYLKFGTLKTLAPNLFTKKGRLHNGRQTRNNLFQAPGWQGVATKAYKRLGMDGTWRDTGLPPAQVADLIATGREAMWVSTSQARSTKSMQAYEAHNLEESRKLVRDAMTTVRASGATWLARLRAGGMISGYTQAAAGLVPPEYKNKCVACGARTRDDISHVLTECPAYSTERSEVLDMLNGFRNEVAEQLPQQNRADHLEIMAYAMLGGRAEGLAPGRRCLGGAGVVETPDLPGRTKTLEAMARYVGCVMRGHGKTLGTIRHLFQQEAEAEAQSGYGMGEDGLGVIAE